MGRSRRPATSAMIFSAALATATFGVAAPALASSTAERWTADSRSDRNLGSGPGQRVVPLERQLRDRALVEARTGTSGRERLT